MREVDEEVRRDQTADFWQRWGLWIAGVVLLGLAAFGGWLYWSNAQRAEAESQVEELSSILESLDEGNFAGADDRLVPLTESDSPGVRAAALLARADLALRQGENEAAVSYFAAVVADEALPEPYRNLALVRQTATEFSRLEPQAVIDRLAPLAQPGTPWFGSAGELTAIALMQQDKNDEAGALWAQIAGDETVPETLRTRAVQMAGVLGVDAVPDEPVDMDQEQPAAAAPVANEAAAVETETTQ